MAKKCSCGFIIEDVDGNWLLCHATHSAHNTYDLPKGCCEPGETHIEAAIRELREETGIVLTQSELDTLVDYGEHPYRSDKSVHLFRVVVSAIYTGSLKCTSFVDTHEVHPVPFPEIDRYYVTSQADAINCINARMRTWIQRHVLTSPTETNDCKRPPIPIFEAIANTADIAGRDRLIMFPLLILMEEVGELTREGIAKENQLIAGRDGIVGESADVVIAAADVAYLQLVRSTNINAAQFDAAINDAIARVKMTVASTPPKQLLATIVSNVGIIANEAAIEAGYRSQRQPREDGIINVVAELIVAATCIAQQQYLAQDVVYEFDASFVTSFEQTIATKLQKWQHHLGQH